MTKAVQQVWGGWFAAIVWLIAVRYVIIGLEYLFLFDGTSKYWVLSSISPVYIGAWMLTIGLIGAVSRFSALSGHVIRARVLTRVFALGVIAHSIFRICVLLDTAPGDPLVVLFLCDVGAMMWLIAGIERVWGFCKL